MALPSKLKFFNVYIDGVGFIGEAKEVTLPKLAMKAEAWRSGGMPGEVDIDLGVEKLELETTFGGPVDDIYKSFGDPVINSRLVRFVGSYQADDTGEVEAWEIVMRGRWSEIDPGSAKAGDDSEFKPKASLTYYKLIQSGEELVEIDMINLIYKVGGVDRYEAHRSALGLAG